jgi:glucose-6-phosphate 1-dehydrogenase
VQITMAEDIGIGGRAGYYDGIGAARDVIQNHLLQLLALTAMEEPVSFDADSLRQEKEKVLSAVRLPADLALGTARGQYAAGWQGGRQVSASWRRRHPPTPHRDLRRRAARRSTPGAGPASRSTCAPASG